MLVPTLFTALRQDSLQTLSSCMLSFSSCFNHDYSCFMFHVAAKSVSVDLGLG